MEIDKDKLIRNLQSTFGNNLDEANHVRLWALPDTIKMDEVLNYLSEKIVDPKYTEQIGENFNDISFLIVTKCFGFRIDDSVIHQKKCVALAKLLRFSPDIRSFSLSYFSKVPSPFEVHDTAPKKKITKTGIADQPSKVDIAQCCYTFLKFDTNYFKRMWKWSEFFRKFMMDTSYKENKMYTLVCNHILALISNMTTAQLNEMNKNIPVEVITQFEINATIEGNRQAFDIERFADKTNTIVWNFENDFLTNVEGVMLPIFDTKNYSFFKSDVDDYIVMVASARQNLRSVSLGIAAGRAVCLSGPVGSGKTTLVEYLAHRTGRIPPKFVDIERRSMPNRTEAKENSSDLINDSTKRSGSLKRNKRKATEAVAKETIDLDTEMDNFYRRSPPNGFLRIQLGDQTDSKMLLGQYRCTDVPGEFIWQPGVLTQAVLNGYWLLLEDLDLCTQDVTMVLANLLENKYLSVPGFRDNLQISTGFQLFITLRTNKGGQHQNSHFQMLEKYLYTINVQSLSRSELCEIVCKKFPKLATISDRIVDVFLTFSSGCHSIDDNFDNDVQMNDEAADEISNNLRAASNSGRLVSTRDLIKLCSRSSPTFSITSQECAYSVFQNAVDLFCSHLVQGNVKNDLIVRIGAKLGINTSRCEYLSNEHKPDVANENFRSIRIGRVELPRRQNDAAENGYMKRQSNEELDILAAQKRLRLDASSHLNIFERAKRKVPNFSFTRLASCILERISMAVKENEPVLLVGETGVGKTSSVQYLSYQTNHKLVVINMNNQSDVSDLIGGFKPVDFNFVIAPLRSEFEQLFKLTFNPSKNEKFLNNISVCYNQGNFSVLIRLMLKIVDTVFTRKPTDDVKTQKCERTFDRWTALKLKLLKLNSQLKQSINISFAFICGPLVNCIKNGDWVLLDEINLASTETLECLSTILEPNGSIVLLEKGDFVPVKRHPDFRIFACMNPSTDIGKKDLADGIRNRFSEFFVDELTMENDLIILVSDYLKNTGIQNTKVLAIVKLYQKLRKMAELELNDGLGNRPVFSLRTLCRALGVCSKNLCGSIERNLYESFCLSFLTQLDPASHFIVLDLIQKSLLSNKKAVLSQKIPKPDGDQIDFQGYWIQKGPKPVQPCENYILTESVQENLKDLARVISIGKLPVLLQGPTSAGKTSLIDYVAKRSGNYCLRINNHEHTDLQEYIGTYTADVTGKLSFKEGVLVQAMRNGFWIILDELNLAPSDILEALNRVLDDNRELFIPETQELVKAHPNFMLFATQNPPGLYGGRKTLSRAFKNRFIELHFSEIPKPELEVILEKRCLIPKSYAQKMVKTMSELQVNRTSATKSSFTLRDLFRWGDRYTFANSELMNDNRYDWNQHLVDEGYLVLSSKLRNDCEADIIENALFSNFRKKILKQNLFDLHDETSLVTKQLLQKIANHPKFDNIVWTQNMRRMAILTGKALEFNEPVLLVGSTGCGKTTICQILADISAKTLRILNCHMHTEGADFLGGLRPYRGQQSTEDGSTRQLFEWADGPLIQAMIDGSFFLADEISLAEDSVLERLNCVLESERTILLAEKGGCNENFLTDQSGEFSIRASDGFQFLATMNPGGDFGKKELSPALRNRFTEVWCRSIDGEEDLVQIAKHSLRMGFGVQNQQSVDTLVADVAAIVVKTVLFIKENVGKFNYSIRDILAWAQFITANSNVNGVNNQISIQEAIIFGLETIFLDSLEMLPHDSYAEIEAQCATIKKYTLRQIRDLLQKSLDINDVNAKKSSQIEDTCNTFGIHPFYVNMNPQRIKKCSDFKFTAPTTKNNLFRLLSAMSLHKAILLEGPPGVGKTSLIENVASTIGYEIVRINLCEHTDLADLFGTDQPSDDNNYKSENEVSDSNMPNMGSFVWRDGPLLAALKAPNTWILLDELNLAPQSVLEGLNAILDHRGEAYVPELNKTFKLDKQTRIFASQNPLKQGGGRKGLPQSFLNRFTKVYLRKLDANDLCHVTSAKYAEYFSEVFTYLLGSCVPDDSVEPTSYFDSVSELGKSKVFDCIHRMVEFSEKLDHGINNLEFGYKGGPYEVNLRDILRWCELLKNEKAGFITKRMESTVLERYQDFILVLYEKMNLVYCHRMRTDTDKAYIRNVFSSVFNVDAHSLEKRSSTIGFYWNDEYIYFNDARIDINSATHSTIGAKPKQNPPLILNSQKELLKSLAECIQMEIPVILCGPTDSGKTKLIDTFCTLSNRHCNVDTIDDSVTGSFQQIDLNRHLEEIAQSTEALMVQQVQNCALIKSFNADTINLLNSWEMFVALNSQHNGFSTESAMSQELVVFNKRLNSLSLVLQLLGDAGMTTHHRSLQAKLKILERIVRNSETLNTGGHFEWVDSKIVRALKVGQYICLEHVNLSSLAILDRLNSLFEPNGRLLMSEKGVNDENQSESVGKHPEFRAVLTLDPKNGEISRAMRNRCIELNFEKDMYSQDDLKALIYHNGIAQMHIIDFIYRIHQRVQRLSEFHTFTVSHLCKFTFLVSENLRLGSDERTALYDSALETYVRSSHTDLLGYGLKFYQNKLSDEIIDELKIQPDHSVNTVNFDNVICRANGLTRSTLIRLQCEPFLTSIRCLTSGMEASQIKKLLTSIREMFAIVSLPVEWSSMKYFLYMLYESSSMADLDLREQYISAMLHKIASDNENTNKCVQTLRSINTHLARIIRSYGSNECKHVPWNSHLFPRIRDYAMSGSSIHDQLKLSAALMAQISFDDIEVDSKVKQSNIDVITYSKAVNAKTIPNGLNKDLITYLYPFLDNIKKVTMQTTHQTGSMSYDRYVQLIFAYLWSNRLNEVAKLKLFTEKSLDQSTIDRITLHFNWLAKHLLSVLNELSTDQNTAANDSTIFMKSLQKITKFVVDNHHPLNEIRKQFVKRLTSFRPFYDLNQLMHYELSHIYAKQTQLLPTSWQQDKKDSNSNPKVSRARIIMNDECTKFRNYLLEHTEANELSWLGELSQDTLPQSEKRDILTTFQQILALPVEVHTNYVTADDFNEKQQQFTDFCKKMNESEKTSDDVSFQLATSLFPIFEYFALKALSSINRQQGHLYSINLAYFEHVRTADADILNLIRTVSTEHFKLVQTFWNAILVSTTSEKEDSFESTIESLPEGFYKKYSSFLRNLSTRIQKFYCNTIAFNQITLNDANEESARKLDSLSINGPVLTAATLSSLFDQYGILKAPGLGDLDVWREVLTSFSKIIWNNIEMIQSAFNLEQSYLDQSIVSGQKLLSETRYIQGCVAETEQNLQFLDEFQEVLNYLDSKIRAKHSSSSSKISPEMRFEFFYNSSLINALVGILELHLLTYMPLVDPVERNRLKKMYIEEDQLHLSRIISAYDFMKVIMSYEDLGEQIMSLLRSKEKSLSSLLEKYSKKCALRPEICEYVELVDQTNFFLENGCRPTSQLKLIVDIDAIFRRINNDGSLTQKDLQNANEIIGRIEWCVNTAESFEMSTISRFSKYYHDFTAPIASSVSMLKCGFTGLKQTLTKVRDTIVLKSNGTLCQINQNETISNELKNLISFPNAQDLNALSGESGALAGIHNLSILDKLDNKDLSYFMLLKANLQKINCSLTVAGAIDGDIFMRFEALLSAFNRIWQTQEEIKRKRAMEEDSLYVNKTRCATEDEEEIINQEIEMVFPNYAEADFSEFIQSATLEKIKEKTPSSTKPHKDILIEEDLKLIAESFIATMFKYSRLEYYKPAPTKTDTAQHRLNLIDSYKTKLKVFQQLVQKYNISLSSSIDDELYNGTGLIIGLVQSDYHMLDMNETPLRENTYNFYKDANIPEIHRSAALLNKVEARVTVELQQWPDHAVLNDIILIIRRIRSLPTTAPVARFSTGFQILRQKVDEWNSVAHKANILRDLEIEIAEYIQRWMKLELQCWRECLITTFEKLSSKAYRYWFFMYNLLHEYLGYSTSNIPCDLTDFKSVEKCIGNSETDVDNAANGTKAKLRSSEVISVLKQFIESSNYAEFSLRMKILKSFEFYLHSISVGANKKRVSLISIIHNLHAYYSQFSIEIDESVKSMRTPIEKKLKEFVKIESYNKDLSYYSMKNNIARVHRHLHKFLREYETALMTKIARVFVWRANQTPSLSSESSGKGINLRHQSRIPYYNVDAKIFGASLTLKEKYASLSDKSSATHATEKPSLLSKVDAYFTTSRNIVKQSISQTQFPTLIHNLDIMLSEQIEACEHLRKLEVDRSQEKPKQKAQAKHILTQKRKALADCYKQLTALGFSFHSGLLENSLNAELLNLKIEPFCLNTTIGTNMKHKNIDQNILLLNEKLGSNFAKCVFKLKLLQTVMMTPNADLGLTNIDRIKGFTVDLFLLVQKQRQNIGKSTIELQQLQQHIDSICDLHAIISSGNRQLSFNALSRKLCSMERSLNRILEMMAEYNLLLKCPPTDEDTSFSVISSSNVEAFTKSSDKYQKTKSTVAHVTQCGEKLLADIKNSKNSTFQHASTVEIMSTEYENIITKITGLCNALVLTNSNEHMILVKPLVDLLNDINLEQQSISNQKITHSTSENHSGQNIFNELANIVHQVLLSMEKIYKKYSTQEQNANVTGSSSSKLVDVQNNTTSKNRDWNDAADAAEPEYVIEEKHLKQKINEEMVADLAALNLPSILGKLSNVITVIRYTSDECTADLSDRVECIQKLVSIVPILEQYNLLHKYYLIQQLGAHKVSTKMLNALLTVFIELGAKGFCIPPDLMQDEDGEKNDNGEGKEGGEFGLEDGTGEKDASDKIESEDQLDTAKKPGDEDKSEQNEDADCKEEKGIDMSEDFDSKLQDIEKRGDDSDESDRSDNEDELDKEMDETEEGADKLDDQIWGSDEEKDDDEEEMDENEMNEEQQGKGSKEEDEQHNDLDTQNDTKESDERKDDGLDAADNDQKEKKNKEKDIDKMDESEVGEEQVNPYHNELEEPPEPEEMNLDNLNLDNEENNEDEERNEENPFDIDKMKEKIENAESEENENEEDGENEEEKMDDENAQLSDDSEDGNDDEELKKDDAEQNNEDVVEETEPETQTPAGADAGQDEETEPENKEEDKGDEKKQNDIDYQQSNDKPSIEDNVQAMPDNKEKGSNDQVQVDSSEMQKQENDMDVQDTGEDREGTGQAENEESKSGHQGIADTKDTSASKKQPEKKEPNERRKPGETNEERTISEKKEDNQKQLRTIQKTSDSRSDDESDESDSKNDEKTDEYQHVKEAKQSDKTTMDNATEEQSKQVRDNQNEQDEPDIIENGDELPEEEKSQNDEDMEDTDTLNSEKNENEKSKERGSKSDRQKEVCETKEEGDVEGEIVLTHTVPRNDDTMAYCSMDVVQDNTQAQDLTNAEILDMRKMFESECTSNKVVHPGHEDIDLWQKTSNKMLPNARELCEQLRLILEPTKCTKLKGDYRTGRRINMKKIIPYIASQFRKDKIWLRRTKPAQRDYKITIAIDDSKSMDYNNSKTLTLQAISLVSQALTLLESGRLSIFSFGESPKIIVNHTDQFDGPKLVNSLNFEQNQSKIAELLDFVCVASSEDRSASSDKGIFENLLLILSDGRNIFSEGERKVRNAIKLARLQRIFIVYIIIDNPENKHSILDIRVPLFSADRKSITMKSYLDTFPFPYYVIVRDLAQLPLVLSDAMRQWFELVSSEL